MNTTPPTTPRPNFGPGAMTPTNHASERQELAGKMAERVWPFNTGQIAVTVPLPMYLNIILALEDKQ